MYPVMLRQLTVMVKEAVYWKEKGRGRQEKETFWPKINRNSMSKKKLN